MTCGSLPSNAASYFALCIIIDVYIKVCVFVAEAASNEINEDRLCYDESLQRDVWIWTGIIQYFRYGSSTGARMRASAAARSVQ
jgi:hypothetical protein